MVRWLWMFREDTPVIRFLQETACDYLQLKLVASDVVLEKGLHTFIKVFIYPLCYYVHL
jgi:hypothetical protein